MERFTDLLFVAQVALLFGALSFWLTPARHPGRAMLVMTAWVALLGYLSLGGYFANFRSLPPRILPALLLPLLAGFLFLRLPGSRELLAHTPLQWVIYAQSFRVVMELILWLLYLQHRVPAIMTFEGRNADILVGLTAIPVGYFCFVRKSWSPRVALWWNVGGILILLNVVVHAQLSTPSPLRVFVTDPPVTFIGYWPYILLPGFLVPLAWLLHAASLIQLRRSRDPLRQRHHDLTRLFALLFVVVVGTWLGVGSACAQGDLAKSLVGKWQGELQLASGVTGDPNRTLIIESVTQKDGTWVATGRFGITGQGLGKVEIEVSESGGRPFIRFVTAAATTIRLTPYRTQGPDGHDDPSRRFQHRAWKRPGAETREEGLAAGARLGQAAPVEDQHLAGDVVGCV